MLSRSLCMKHSDNWHNWVWQFHRHFPQGFDVRKNANHKSSCLGGIQRPKTKFPTHLPMSRACGNAVAGPLLHPNMVVIVLEVLIWACTPHWFGSTWHKTWDLRINYKIGRVGRKDLESIKRFLNSTRSIFSMRLQRPNVLVFGNQRSSFNIEIQDRKGWWGLASKLAWSVSIARIAWTAVIFEMHFLPLPNR